MLEVLKNLDVKVLCALITLIGSLGGVIIGALISCGTTFFLDCIKSKREEKLHYKRKREETYIEMQDFITDLNAHWNELKKNFLNNDLRLKYNALRSKAHTYCKKEIVDYFYEIANDLMTGKIEDNIQERMDNFISMIKRDLKIEG